MVIAPVVKGAIGTVEIGLNPNPPYILGTKVFANVLTNPPDTTAGCATFDWEYRATGAIVSHVAPVTGGGATDSFTPLQTGDWKLSVSFFAFCGAGILLDYGVTYFTVYVILAFGGGAGGGHATEV
jgi:hypothetical protein